MARVDFELQPLKVALGDIALTDFYGRIVLSADARLNLQDLMSTPGTTQASKPPAGKPAAPAPESKSPTPTPAAAPAAAPLPIRLGPMKLRGGTIDFSDFFIKPNYSAKLSDIQGTLTEMAPDKAVEIALHAKAEGTAEIEIHGRANPLAPTLSLDIEGMAKGIELPPMSTYSVKYVGHKIEQGKLSLNVKYRVENGKLAAENNIILDQLTFGEKVDSPDATTLPVRTAVEILKDRNGVINVKVPVSGSLDDPNFSITAAVTKAVGNLITKAVTAPFSVLGAIVGGGEELSYVEFAPGSAALDAGGIAKLETLTKAAQRAPQPQARHHRPRRSRGRSRGRRACPERRGEGGCRRQGPAAARGRTRRGGPAVAGG